MFYPSTTRRAVSRDARALGRGFRRDPGRESPGGHGVRDGLHTERLRRHLDVLRVRGPVDPDLRSPSHPHRGLPTFGSVASRRPPLLDGNLPPGTHDIVCRKVGSSRVHRSTTVLCLPNPVPISSCQPTTSIPFPSIRPDLELRKLLLELCYHFYNAQKIERNPIHRVSILLMHVYL